MVIRPQTTDHRYTWPTMVTLDNMVLEDYMLRLDILKSNLEVQFGLHQVP